MIVTTPTNNGFAKACPLQFDFQVQGSLDLVAICVMDTDFTLMFQIFFEKAYYGNDFNLPV